MYSDRNACLDTHADTDQHAHTYPYPLANSHSRVQV
jgi:hypothetical protein